MTPQNFQPACLTPLTDTDLRGLAALTARWSPPAPGPGTTSQTLSPAAYHRQRIRGAVLAFAIAMALLTLGPSLVALLAHLTDDAPAASRILATLPWFVAGGTAMGLVCAAISWHFSGGKHRTQAGAEPRNQLTFTAAADSLTVANAAGWRLSAPWHRWRLAQVRTSITETESTRFYNFEAAQLVRLAEDGTSSGQVFLDAATLSNGRPFAATVIAMIASRQ
jgi:hypothetical protein